MAIYHLSTKHVSRSSGRTATASIAYRAGIKIEDERKGKIYDYTKRGGVVSTKLHLPNNIEISRSELWNMAEQKETRKNSRTAREIVVNLPHELNEKDRETLVNDFAKSLSDKYNIAVDVAIHEPDKGGDNRNHHAHLLMTTRNLEIKDKQIKLTSKSQLEMSNTQLKNLNLPKAQEELKSIRKLWADMTNEKLAERGKHERIDHRSHKERGIQQQPTIKMGWKATQFERKGIKTAVGDINREIKKDNRAISALNEQQRAERKAQAELAKKQAEERAKQPTSAENRALIKDYENKISYLAEILRNREKTELSEKMERLKEIYNDIRDNQEPLLFGKKEWQAKLDGLKEQYHEIKKDYDRIKDKVLDKHFDRAVKQIINLEPDLSARVAKAMEIEEEREKAKELQNQKNDQKARTLGANEYAREGETYSGRIKKVDKNGAFQLSMDKIIYHEGLTKVKEGYGYRLTRNDNIYSIQEYAKPREQPQEQTQEKNKGLGR